VALFDFHPDKSQTNKVKQGVDFEEAQEIWSDDNAIEGEERFNRTGSIGKRQWTAFSHTAKAKSVSSQSDGLTELSRLPMTAEEADRRFDDGESVFALGFDPAKARRPGLEIKRITVDLPAPFLEHLDHWAAVREMTRQALIKSWFYDRLEKQST
jgi:uncharacterized DUF497 family protein